MIYVIITVIVITVKVKNNTRGNKMYRNAPKVGTYLQGKRSYLEDIFDKSIKRYSLPEPIREYPFRGWRFDYCWPQVKVFVEIDGGTYMGGHHVVGKGYERDCKKNNQAQLEGWIVLRADRNMANTFEFATIVKKTIQRRMLCLKKNHV